MFSRRPTERHNRGRVPPVGEAVQAGPEAVKDDTNEAFVLDDSTDAYVNDG